MSEPTTAGLDQWARWVARNREGTTPEINQRIQEAVVRQVLKHFAVTEGETILDVGTGDGLIGFGLLPRVGESGTVILSDVSQDLLTYCRTLADRMGVSERCQFLRTSADDLSGLPDASVDVITLKAVLIYVKDKARAFAEFCRVLRPGGRLYVEEPINRFGSDEPDHRFWGYDVTDFQPIAARVKAVYTHLQPRNSDPMLDFDERDLLAHVEREGFAKIDLELRASIDQANRVGAQLGWSTFFETAGNPRIPCLREAIEQVLGPDEAQAFIQHLRARVENDAATTRSARAFIWCVK